MYYTNLYLNVIKMKCDNIFLPYFVSVHFYINSNLKYYKKKCDNILLTHFIFLY